MCDRWFVACEIVCDHSSVTRKQQSAPNGNSWKKNNRRTERHSIVQWTWRESKKRKSVWTIAYACAFCLNASNYIFDECLLYSLIMFTSSVCVGSNNDSTSNEKKIELKSFGGFLTKQERDWLRLIEFMNISVSWTQCVVVDRTSFPYKLNLSIAGSARLSINS